MDDTGYKIFDIKKKLVEEESGVKTDGPHLQNFLDAVRNGQSLNCEVEEGHKSTMLCHLGNIAYRTGQTITVDPATGRIQNNAAANKLWACEYRKGWFPNA